MLSINCFHVGLRPQPCCLLSCPVQCHACLQFEQEMGRLFGNVHSKIILTDLIVCAGSEVDLSKTDDAKSGAVLAPEIELHNSPIPSRVTAPAAI